MLEDPTDAAELQVCRTNGSWCSRSPSIAKRTSIDSSYVPPRFVFSAVGWVSAVYEASLRRPINIIYWQDIISMSYETVAPSRSHPLAPDKHLYVWAIPSLVQRQQSHSPSISPLPLGDYIHSLHPFPGLGWKGFLSRTYG